MPLNKDTAKMRDGQVWIELHPPLGDADYAQRQCDAANTMLRLLFGHDTYYKFWPSNRRTAYCLTMSPAGNYIELRDHGHWFVVDSMTTVNWRWVDANSLEDLPPLKKDSTWSEEAWLAFADGTVKMGHWLHGSENRAYPGFVHDWFARSVDESGPPSQCQEAPIAWARIGPPPTFPKEALPKEDA